MNLEHCRHLIDEPSHFVAATDQQGMSADHMAQPTSSFWPFNPLHYFLPALNPAVAPPPPAAPDMSYSNRQLSPGGRRIVNPGRVSESAVTDPNYHQRHNAYASPRTSGGVIPISTETFVNVPPPSTAGRIANRYDAYSTRPRRSSLVDTTRASSAAVNQLPSRSRPMVVQQADSVRTSSPGRSGHKKVYSVDDGAARLVADVNVPVTVAVDRNHRRRDSGSERTNRRLSDAAKDRGRKVYHSNGYYRPSQATIDDENAFSYTDPAGMYRDTEPRWREVRPRRGSLDRSGGNRERPVSMLDPNTDPRRSTRDVGPPPSTRGWDRINEGLGRSRSVREVSQSPSRGRGYSDLVPPGEIRDPYYNQGGTGSSDRQITMPFPDRYEDYSHDEPRSPRRHERRNSVTRAERADRSVERRGFGIRTDARNVSRDPYGRGSDESFEQSKYRDPAVVELQRHNTLPEYPYQDSRRLEPERRDREPSQRPNDTRDRQHDRDVRDKETRRRDDERAYGDRDHDRPRDHGYDVDRERERDRARQLEPPSDHDRDRHHRRDNDRKEHSPRHSGESVSSPSLAQAATGGLAGVAAALGATNLLKRVTGDKSERDDRDRPRERRSPQPADEQDRDQDRDRQRERDRDRERERDRERDRDRDRDRDRENDRGLGFAYENSVAPPEPPRSAPPNPQERPAPRDVGYESTDKPVGMPAPALDPNEEYRRRMEQIQRELGGPAADQRTSDDDADRERRRREREQRQRSTDGRSGHAADNAARDGANHEGPPSLASRRNLDVDDRSLLTASSSGSSDTRKRQSILDKPLTNEPAEIIDNTMSDKRENRVRIVDPPMEEEEKKPKGILKKPTEKFPEDHNVIREGVAPLKDSSKRGIPPGARWTKIDRRLVNPEALEKQGERYEERLDCVIVLRVLTKDEIQKLADLTRDLRERRHEDDRAERKAARRHERHNDRHERDEYSDDSEDEFKERAPRMLEAPPSAAGAPSETDYVREGRDRRRDRDRDRDSEASYNMSGGLGRRD